jgi:hypothetical protein
VGEQPLQVEHDREQGPEHRRYDDERPCLELNRAQASPMTL